mmetsp:Transcript_9796/g.20917  ORF Transcript_9796/g.20917 Transcript_9796/m.20917 type:complete len:130 (+) Transcript_9796:470-859(+)
MHDTQLLRCAASVLRAHWPHAHPSANEEEQSKHEARASGLPPTRSKQLVQDHALMPGTATHALQLARPAASLDLLAQEWQPQPLPPAVTQLRQPDRTLEGEVEEVKAGSRLTEKQPWHEEGSLTVLTHV